MSDAQSAIRAIAECANGIVALQVRGRGGYFAELIRRTARGDADARREIAGEIERAAAVSAAPQLVPTARAGRSVAVVSVKGIALFGLELQPFAFSTMRLAETMNALAADQQIVGIVLDFATPGGVVTGTPEAADAIFRARQVKPVIALVNPLAASAGYWLASQATKIVMLGSGEIGSIGVFVLHVDISAALEMDGVKPTFIFSGDYKTEANPFEPLSPVAQDYLQGQVDKTNAQFVRAVARGRGVSVTKVNADFGRGRTLLARDALGAGMVDQIGDLATALRAAAGPRAPGIGATADASFPTAAADARAQVDDEEEEEFDKQLGRYVVNVLLDGNKDQAEKGRAYIEAIDERAKARARRRRLDLLKHG